VKESCFILSPLKKLREKWGGEKNRVCTYVKQGGYHKLTQRRKRTGEKADRVEPECPGSQPSPPRSRKWKKKVTQGPKKCQLRKTEFRQRQ